MDRRSFLRSGLAAGAWGVLASSALVPSRAAWAASSPAPPMPGAVSTRAPRRLRIGLLVPRSEGCPLLGDGFLRGFEDFWRTGDTGGPGGRMARLGRGPAPELLPADADRGFEGAGRMARTLLDEGCVDLVVAGVSAPVAARLRNLFEERQVPLLVSSIGATARRSAHRSPYVFTSSLGLWEASAAMGRWSAFQLGRSCLVLTSAFDSGFDHVRAFRLGFESAGGRVAGTVVTHAQAPAPRGSASSTDPLEVSGPGLECMAGAVRRSGADFVHAAYSGREALDFFRAWQESGLSRRLPLSCGGFAVEDYLLARHGSGAAGATSSLGWATGLTGASRGGGPGGPPRPGGAPGARRTRGTARPGGPEEGAADVFWAMGHDAAALVAHGRQACGGRFDPEPFLAALGSAEVDGARGPLRGDAAARHAAGPLYLRVVASGDHGWHNRIAEQLVHQSPDSVGDTLGAVPAAGWINEYLCT